MTFSVMDGIVPGGRRITAKLEFQLSWTDFSWQPGFTVIIIEIQYTVNT